MTAIILNSYSFHKIQTVLNDTVKDKNYLKNRQNKKGENLKIINK